MECKRCGECCLRMIIEIDQDDIDREPMLAGYVRPIKNPFSGKPDGAGWGFAATHVEGCPMLDEKTRECMLWDTRPRVCRQFEPGSNQCRWMRGEISLDRIRDTRDKIRADGLSYDADGQRSVFL